MPGLVQNVGEQAVQIMPPRCASRCHMSLGTRSCQGRPGAGGRMADRRMAARDAMGASSVLEGFDEEQRGRRMQWVFVPSRNRRGTDACLTSDRSEEC
jgi:hypothetical protein